MPKKTLDKIKHGQKVLDAVGDRRCFVVDIQKASGLDDRTLRTVVNRLHKNGFLVKDVHGQWSVAEAI